MHGPRLRRVTVATRSYDDLAAAAGICTSPDPLDFGYLGLMVPTPATSHVLSNRYLGRLCCVSVGTGEVGIVRSLRQFASIRGGYYTDADSQVVQYVEREIKSPQWRLNDGNISWHLRKVHSPESDGSAWSTTNNATWDAQHHPGFTRDPYACDVGWLYVTLPTGYGGADVYRGSCGCDPPGQSIGHLGTWNDLRFPWRDLANEDLHIPVVGPCKIVLWASVWQAGTQDPQPYSCACSDFWLSQAVEPETSFAQYMTDTKYCRVAGELTVDIHSTEKGG